MSTIAGMKLVASKKSRSLSPIQLRRNKLAAKIHGLMECELKSQLPLTPNQLSQLLQLLGL